MVQRASNLESYRAMRMICRAGFKSYCNGREKQQKYATERNDERMVCPSNFVQVLSPSEDYF